jgi:hypothetical protein
VEKKTKNWIHEMSSERLNAERKRDLEAHYEKEARLLGPRPVASGDVAASKPRKGLNVKFPEPYSRDPNRLFIQVVVCENARAHGQPAPAQRNLAVRVIRLHPPVRVCRKRRPGSTSRSPRR